MTLQFRENLQEAWDMRCKSRGYIPRGGMETRFTETGDMYYILGGFGRVEHDNHLGWIIVLSVQGFDEKPYQYVKCDETKWDELEMAVRFDRR